MTAGSTIVGWILSPVRQMGKGNWPNSIHSAIRTGGVAGHTLAGADGPYGGSTRRPWHSRPIGRRRKHPALWDKNESCVLAVEVRVVEPLTSAVRRQRSTTELHPQLRQG